MSALHPSVSVPELVPGDPSRVLSLATQLLLIAAGFDQTARALSPRAEAWFGPAQQAFAAVLGVYPPVYQRAAESFAGASVACRSHAHELEAAQAQAHPNLRRHVP